MPAVKWIDGVSVFGDLEMFNDIFMVYIFPIFNVIDIFQSIFWTYTYIDFA